MPGMYIEVPVYPVGQANVSLFGVNLLSGRDQWNWCACRLVYWKGQCTGVREYTSLFRRSMYYKWVYISSLTGQSILFGCTLVSVYISFVYTWKWVHFIFYSYPSVSLLQECSYSSLFDFSLLAIGITNDFPQPFHIEFTSLHRNREGFLLCIFLSYEIFFPHYILIT